MKIQLDEMWFFRPRGFTYRRPDKTDLRPTMTDNESDQWLQRDREEWLASPDCHEGEYENSLTAAEDPCHA